MKKIMKTMFLALLLIGGGMSVTSCDENTVSQILGLLLGPDKEASSLYLFLGYYPLLKPRLDAIRPAVLGWVAKISLAAAAITAMYALLLYVFALDGLEEEFATALRWVIWGSSPLSTWRMTSSGPSSSRMVVSWSIRKMFSSRAETTSSGAKGMSCTIKPPAAFTLPSVSTRTPRPQALPTWSLSVR